MQISVSSVAKVDHCLHQVTSRSPSFSLSFLLLVPSSPFFSFILLPTLLLCQSFFLLNSPHTQKAINITVGPNNTTVTLYCFHRAGFIVFGTCFFLWHCPVGPVLCCPLLCTTGSSNVMYSRFYSCNLSAFSKTTHNPYFISCLK